MKKIFLFIVLAFIVKVKAQNLQVTPLNVARYGVSDAIRFGIGATNPTTLGIIRITQGNGIIDLGQASSGFSNIWLGQGTPSGINYALGGDVNSTYLNAPSSVVFSTGNSSRGFLSSSQFSLSVPLLANSTSTLVGTVTASSLTSAVNLIMNSGSNTNLSVGGTTRLNAYGSGVDITGVLNVSSNAKFSATQNTLGATVISSAQTSTLTMGATSGTNAVLSDINLNIDLSHNTFNPADASTYYIFSLPQQSASEGLFKLYIPYNVTLTGYSGNIYSGVAGSSENTTLNIVSGGVTSSTTSITSGANFAIVAQTYSATGLSVNINAGSYMELQMICPTWATNPTGVLSFFKLYFVRRQ